jgi:hypothetical protein
VTIWSSNGGTNQKWSFTAAGGRFGLRNVSTGLAMETAGGSTSPGTPVTVWTANGGTNQQWVLAPVS